MNHKNPLRVLILLPLVLATLVGAQLYVAPSIRTVAASPDPTIQMFVYSNGVLIPTGVTHSIGPEYFPGVISVEGHGFFDIFVDVLNVGPDDIDAWNLAGKFDERYFTILFVRDGGVLNDACADLGGSVLFQASVDTHTAAWGASKLCTAGVPFPDPGFTGSGHLLQIRVKLNKTGCGAYTLNASESFLRNLSGFDTFAVPATVVGGGVFCNTPDFSADFSGHSSNASPRKASLGGTVGFHSNIQGNGAVQVVVVYRILRPDGRLDYKVSGPMTIVPGTGQNMPDVSYTPPKIGDYSVGATLLWSEDGGLNFIYRGSTESKNFDFTVAA